MKCSAQCFVWKFGKIYKIQNLKIDYKGIDMSTSYRSQFRTSYIQTSTTHSHPHPASALPTQAYSSIVICIGMFRMLDNTLLYAMWFYVEQFYNGTVLDKWQWKVILLFHVSNFPTIFIYKYKGEYTNYLYVYTYRNIPHMRKFCHLVCVSCINQLINSRCILWTAYKTYNLGIMLNENACELRLHGIENRRYQ